MQNWGSEIRESHDLHTSLKRITDLTDNLSRISSINAIGREIVRRHDNVSMFVLYSELSCPNNNVLGAVEVKFCEIWVGVLIYTGPNCMTINIVSSWLIQIDQVSLISYKLV